MCNRDWVGVLPVMSIETAASGNATMVNKTAALPVTRQCWWIPIWNEISGKLSLVHLQDFDNLLIYFPHIILSVASIHRRAVASAQRPGGIHAGKIRPGPCQAGAIDERHHAREHESKLKNVPKWRPKSGTQPDRNS